MTNVHLHRSSLRALSALVFACIAAGVASTAALGATQEDKAEFAVKAGTLEEHVMHEERFEISAPTAQAINHTRQSGRRVIAVGTTTVRVLESVAAANQGRLVECQGRTRIFIHPPHLFHVADALLTNFHLPRSTLLMLVSAFAAPGQTRGRDVVLSAYSEVIRQRYRFYSYGDAMLIL